MSLLLLLLLLLLLWTEYLNKTYNLLYRINCLDHDILTIYLRKPKRGIGPVIGGFVRDYQGRVYVYINFRYRGTLSID